MPSLRTRARYQEIVLNGAQEALDDAATSVATATAALDDLTGGTLDLDAVTVGGVRFIESGGALVPEP